MELFEATATNSKGGIGEAQNPWNLPSLQKAIDKPGEHVAGSGVSTVFT